jgi:hypothetical protein
MKGLAEIFQNHHWRRRFGDWLSRTGRRRFARIPWYIRTMGSAVETGAKFEGAHLVKFLVFFVGHGGK